jgi:hypothetical protein
MKLATFIFASAASIFGVAEAEPLAKVTQKAYFDI